MNTGSTDEENWMDVLLKLKEENSSDGDKKVFQNMPPISEAEFKVAHSRSLTPTSSEGPFSSSCRL